MVTANSHRSRHREKSQVRNSVHWMRNFASIYGLIHLGLGIWATFPDGSQESFHSTLVFIGLALYGFIILVGAFRLRFEIHDGSIVYRGFISNARVPIRELDGVFVERYDGGIFFFLKGPRFLRVLVVQGDFGVKQLDGTAGREKNVQQLKRRILDYLPQDHPQRRRVGRGPGGVHRKHRRE